MKHTQLKAFTLVEMLIVIVIIGILISALLPRLQGAQGMARDTARKTALSQIGAGITAYQSQYGERPLKGGVATGTDALKLYLVDKGLMTDVPKDRLTDNIVSGLGTGVATGEFLYVVWTRNSVPNGGFVLMAHTETPGNSNWVVGSGNTGKIWNGWITDLKDVLPCTSVELSGSTTLVTGGACTAASLNDLRYIYLY